LKGFGGDFHPFTPQLEMHYALNEAKKVNAEIVLGGLEIDEITVEALKNEPY